MGCVIFFFNPEGWNVYRNKRCEIKVRPQPGSNGSICHIFLQTYDAAGISCVVDLFNPEGWNAYRNGVSTQKVRPRPGSDGMHNNRFSTNIRFRWHRFQCVFMEPFSF